MSFDGAAGDPGQYPSHPDHPDHPGYPEHPNPWGSPRARGRSAAPGTAGAGIHSRIRAWIWTWICALICLPAYPAEPAQAPEPQPAPARPDTAVVRLDLPPGSPAVLAVHVRPDTVDFGGVWQVAVDFAGAAPPDSSLRMQAPWLEPIAPARRGFLSLGNTADPGKDLPAWPEAPPGTGRLVRSLRVYGTDPFRLEWGAADSPAVTVRGRVDDAGQAAPVRDPRPLGLALAVWVWVLLAAAVVALMSWWFRRRRRRAPADDPDVPLAPIAWLVAVQELRRLMDDTVPATGDGRLFLDRLTGIMRAYIGGRYLVGAREMTGREIVAACRARGYRLEAVKALAALVDQADRRRYGPSAPSPEDCREAAARFLGLMGQVRILPRITPVTTDDLVRGGAAWDFLAGQRVGAVAEEGR